MITLKDWQSDHWKSIYNSYSSYPYFDRYESELKKFYKKKWIKLIDLNTNLLLKFLEWLNVKKKIVKASEYKLRNRKSDLIIEMCKTLKYQNYLFGELGKNYCDIKKFEEFKIKPFFQKYNHPKYEVIKKENFMKISVF